nr:hypothetical protein [Tanacetum cinerariifolium]
MVEKSKEDEDTQGKDIDPTHYRSMVGTLMYLTSSRPYLDSAIALIAFADADHAGCQDTRRSTSGMKISLASIIILYDLDCPSVKCLFVYELYVTNLSRIMSSITAQQTKIDLELVPKEKRLETRKCNERLNLRKKQREPTFQVVLDALALTLCYSAFLTITDVLEVYMHQFWDSIHKDEDDNNNDHDSKSEGSDQKRDSGDDNTQSNNKKGSDFEHETDENETGSESNQEENEEEIKYDKEEEEDEFVKTPSNDTDDEDDTKIKSERDKDEGMDYTTNQFDDDVNVRLNVSIIMVTSII